MRGVQLSRRTTESLHINDVGTAIELYTIQGRSKASGIWNDLCQFLPTKSHGEERFFLSDWKPLAASGEIPWLFRVAFLKVLKLLGIAYGPSSWLQLFESLAAYVQKDWLHNTDPQLDLEHEIHASPWQCQLFLFCWLHPRFSKLILRIRVRGYRSPYLCMLWVQQNTGPST